MRLFERHAGRFVMMTLADLLREHHWPNWLDMQVAVAWAIQLCRVVARLHRQGTILVDLEPSMILIDESGKAAWSPLLLVSWPPSPCFWPGISPDLSSGEREYRVKVGDRAVVGDRAEASSAPTNAEDYFPLAFPPLESAFAAPELLSGFYDERADVYALGAMLYLLLTGYAPVSAMRRLLHADNHVDGLELVSPRFFRPQMPTILEEIVFHALALEPDERYPSVFALIEALEEV
jgi:serine/threonine protein kinase